MSSCSMCSAPDFVFQRHLPVLFSPLSSSKLFLVHGRHQAEHHCLCLFQAQRLWKQRRILRLAYQNLGGCWSRGPQGPVHSAFAYVCGPDHQPNTLFKSFNLEASNGGGFLHKSKLNNNGSFSVGKTWRLTELRGLQALGVSMRTYACGLQL
jgi:hypothetical protein